MKALVTGACGFVGSYLIERLLASGEEVVGTFLNGVQHEVSGCTYVKMDVCDRQSVERVCREVNPDVVYHLAGIAFIPDALKNFERTFEIHVTGVFYILEALKKLDKKVAFVFASSSEVYGGIAEKSLIKGAHEDQMVRPKNIYSVSKASAELLLLQYNFHSNITPIVVRPFNHTGPRQSPQFVVIDFASQVARIEKGIQEPVLQVGNLTSARDFSDVRDIVAGYHLLSTQKAGIYNLSSGTPVTIQKVLEKLVSFSSKKIQIHTDPMKFRESDIPLFIGDSSKARALGWTPTHKLDETLRDVYEYWLKISSN